MKKSRNIHFHIKGGNNQILPNAETGIQNVYDTQTIASYKKKSSLSCRTSCCDNPVGLLMRLLLPSSQCLGRKGFAI